MTRNQKAWYEMTLAHMRHNQPTHYVDDFIVHDRAQLGQFRIPEARSEFELPEGSPFAWILRDCGTEILCPFEHHVGMGTHARATAHYYQRGGFANDNVHCFVWDGDALVECTLPDMCRWLSIGVVPQPLGETTYVVCGP